MAQMSEVESNSAANEDQVHNIATNDSQSNSSFNSVCGHCFLFAAPTNRILLPIPQFNDKEEIRRRLAFEIDDDDPIAQYKLSRKSRKSLSSRMQNIDSLQICFLNENNVSYPVLWTGDNGVHEFSCRIATHSKI